MLNLLSRSAIILRSAATTFYYCCVALFVVVIPPRSRARTDRCIRAWSHSLLKIIKLHYKVVNPYQVEFLPNKNYILMCNHTSIYDIPLSIVAINGSVRMVAKKELSRIPLFGYAMKKSEFVFIDRKNRNQAIKDLATAAEKMRSGIVIWIAPEGTRSRDGKLLPFKKGGFMLALETGATIVPIGIRGAMDIVQPRTLKIIPNQQAEIHIGQPIDASRYTAEQREQLMQAVAQGIRKAAGMGQ